MGLESAGPAVVIRSYQRDKEFIQRLKNDVDEMILEVFGQRAWLKYQEYSQHTSTLIYYALTNLLGNQTLGEEYVGIVQLNANHKAIPSKKTLSVMIFVEAFGMPFINYVTKLIENFNARQSGNCSYLPKYLTVPLKTLVDIGNFYGSFQPLLTQLHLALFYMNGKFYQFSKRICGIHYVLLRQSFWNEDEISKRNLKYLMWMSVLNLSITISHDTFNFISNKMRKSSDVETSSPSSQLRGNDEYQTPSISDVDSTKKCSLCLEFRRHSSVTPCGHVFCWRCIMDWLRSETACPMCRELIMPSRIVPLQNFS